jgi:hypothetical protein
MATFYEKFVLFCQQAKLVEYYTWKETSFLSLEKGNQVHSSRCCSSVVEVGPVRLMKYSKSDCWVSTGISMEIYKEQWNTFQ